MTLSFLHGGIALLGVAAASIPIIIHLMLKQRPKPILFPAMQLILKRQTRTMRKLRLRHLLLLALRVGLILLLALALARPTLKSSMFKIDQQAPVGAVLIFDTSLSMQLKHHGMTRLEKAKELSKQVIQRFPERSEVTVLDSSRPATTPPMDLSGALLRIDETDIDPTPRSLNDALAIAYRSLGQSQLARREVYLFTDLASNSWNLGDGSRLARLAELIETGVLAYVIDVSAENASDAWIGSVKVTQQVLPVDGELTLSATIGNVGPARDLQVRLELDGEPRDLKRARLPADQSQNLSFRASGLAEGIHQGSLSIIPGDEMPFDDIRYFTVEARPALRILLASDEPGDTFHLSNALVPEVWSVENRERFAVIDRVDSRDLEVADLDGYSVVALLNVGSPSQDAWIRLGNFVRGGGGLFVALGARVDAVSYNSAAAQAILPGKLGAEVGSADGVFLAPDRFTHPLLAAFRERDNDLSIAPVLKYRQVEPVEGAVNVIRYSDGSPGLLERSFGAGTQGRSLLLTTAAHYRPSADAWTELPLTWPYLALVRQMVHYLAGIAETKFTYQAGDNVIVTIGMEEPFTLFSVTNPQQQVERLTIDQRSRSVTIPSVNVLGHWRVDSTEAGRKFALGFSVNEPEAESDLRQVDTVALAEMIGKERLSIAHDPDELIDVIDEARVGRELYPWLMLLVLVIVCVEGYLANRFYKSPSTRAT